MNNVLTRRLGLLSTLLGLLSLVLLAVSAWGFRANGWPWPQAYNLTGWGVWAAITGVIMAAAALLGQLRKPRNGVIIALVGLVLSLPVAGLGLAFEIASRTTPWINDISTDTEDPPVFWFTATPSDYPAQNGAPQRATYPGVRTLDLPLSVEDAFEGALTLVQSRGWEVLSADPDESQIEAIARSRIFGFEDEVAIRFTQTDTGTAVDIRSRSRLGQTDRGANARRIQAFFADLKQQTAE